MPGDEERNLSAGIRLILEEIHDLKRETLKHFQGAESDRRQATLDRASLAEYIRSIHKAERKDRQELARVLERLGSQQIVLAKILERQTDRIDQVATKVDQVGAKIDQGTQVLGEIRDLLRRNGKS